jgi:hypothetical protein
LVVEAGIEKPQMPDAVAGVALTEPVDDRVALQVVVLMAVTSWKATRGPLTDRLDRVRRKTLRMTDPFTLAVSVPLAVSVLV